MFWALPWWRSAIFRARRLIYILYIYLVSEKIIYQKKTKTRNIKKPTSSTEISEATLAELFDNMQVINRLLLSYIEILSKENKAMKTQIASIMENKRTYIPVQ